MAVKKPEVRYFIVSASSLTDYGRDIGSDREEAEQLLAEAEGEQLVVIKGVLIKPKFVLED